MLVAERLSSSLWTTVGYLSKNLNYACIGFCLTCKSLCINGSDGCVCLYCGICLLAAKGCALSDADVRKMNWNRKFWDSGK